MKQIFPLIAACLLLLSACDGEINLNRNPNLNAAAGAPMTVGNGGEVEMVVDPLKAAADEQNEREKAAIPAEQAAKQIKPAPKP
jgi:hypothetical protein